MPIAEIPFTYEARLRTAQKRKEQVATVRDTVYAEIPEVTKAEAPEVARRLGSQVRALWRVHGGKLYEAVLSQWADGRAATAADLSAEWLTGDASPVLPHSIGGRPAPIHAVRTLPEIAPRQVLNVNFEEARAAAVERAGHLLLVDGMLFKHSTGPLHTIEAQKSGKAFLVTGTALQPAPAAFRFLFRDGEAALETARTLFKAVEDHRLPVDELDPGVTLRHGEEDLLRAGLAEMVETIRSALSRNLSYGALMALADYQEAKALPPEAVADFARRLDEGTPDLRELKTPDRLRLRALAARADLLATPEASAAPCP